MSENHFGQHLRDEQEAKRWYETTGEQCCSECITYLESWTHTAAIAATYEEVADELRTRAGNAFASRNDDRAHLLRNLAEHFESVRKPHHVALQQFIESAYPSATGWGNG